MQSKTISRQNKEEASVSPAIKGFSAIHLERAYTHNQLKQLVPRAFQIAEIQHGERLTFNVLRMSRGWWLEQKAGGNVDALVMNWSKPQCSN